MRAMAIGAGMSLGLLAGCAWQGPSLAGYAGGQYAVTSYYANNAIENNMNCTSPAMTPVRTELLSEDGGQAKVLVRYNWYDSNQKGSRGAATPGNNHSSSNRGFCNGWSERTFTLAKNPDGGVSVVSMTGPQRGNPPTTG